jgi:hypothetical protein
MTGKCLVPSNAGGWKSHALRRSFPARKCLSIMCPLSKGHAPAIHGHPAGGGTAARVNKKGLWKPFFDEKKIFFIQVYTPTPPKNPRVLKRRGMSITATMTTPTPTMTGRRTAKTAFPVEIPWPSLTPRMKRMIQ